MPLILAYIELVDGILIQGVAIKTICPIPSKFQTRIMERLCYGQDR